MKKTVLIATLSLLLGISLLTWKRIVVSIISAFLSAMQAFLNSTEGAESWNVDLIEYWLAGMTWLVVFGFVVREMFTLRAAQRHGAAESFLAVLVVVAMLAPFLAPLPPNVQADPETSRLRPPLSPMTIVESSSEFSFGDLGVTEPALRRANAFLLDRKFVVADESLPGRVFLFGTDDVGRDVFSRVMAGARVSLCIGMSAALAALIIGTIVGCTAGYAGRFMDSLLMRTTDLFLSIPGLFLVIATMAMLGQSSVTLVLVLGLTGWMGIARTVRTEVTKLREKEFVLAARMLNQTPGRILLRHILPNLYHMLATAAVLQFGSAVLAEASLSFLGLGIQPPTASWGNMLGQSLGYLRHGWWLAVFPGLVLASVLIAVQMILDRREPRA